MPLLIERLLHLACVCALFWVIWDAGRRAAHYRELWTRLLYENGALKARVIGLTAKLDGSDRAMAALRQDENQFFFGDHDPAENRERMEGRFR